MAENHSSLRRKSKQVSNYEHGHLEIMGYHSNANKIRILFAQQEMSVQEKTWQVAINIKKYILYNREEKTFRYLFKYLFKYEWRLTFVVNGEVVIGRV